MKVEQKSILIHSIIQYLSEQNQKKNKELATQNLYQEQKPFDADDMWITLAFMADDEVNKIASKILG